MPRFKFIPETRRGSMMTELIVAAILLITAMSSLGTIAFRTSKLWQDSRHYTLALNELSNQLERLTALSESELEEQLEKLTVSPEIASELASPQLDGKKISDSNGTRIVLTINWERIGKAEPLSLVGWLASAEVEP